MCVNDQMKRLIVYARRECHLCKEMIDSLRSIQENHPFELEIIDIDLDHNLIKLYNERVPVLFVPDEGRELCHHHLDLSLVSHYLAGN